MREATMSDPLPRPGRRRPIDPDILVERHRLALMSMTSTEALDRFAARLGIDTRSLARRFVTALSERAGIDYEQMLRVELAREGVDSVLADRARIGPRLLMWSAATTDMFTVCGADRRPAWRDTFTPEDLGSGRVSTVAALKAIELAGHWIAEWGAQAGTLRLNLATNQGIDLAGLHRFAGGVSVVVDVAAVPLDNPAAQQCLHREPVSSRYLDLTDLLHPPGAPA
ncbi:hypothetical protein [Nocardia sp. NPDC058497]|uniref:hypothetical protein n=1 Tax=Nocardia sp. NPDC058497 TaxID=3346529 RepID=UPI003655641A